MQSGLSAYDFFAPPRIVFGWGRRADIGVLARSLGQRALLVWGSKQLRENTFGDELRAALMTAGVAAVELATIRHEPTVDDVDRATGELRQLGLVGNEVVVAIGGGSAIDLAKAVAAMATNRESSTVRDYLEGVGRGLQLNQPPLPILAVPTTAGTGSEATKNAVISCYDPPFKKSLRSDLLVPRIVLVDPQLTVSLPRATTIHTGMDAITQLIESYISRKAKPMPQALAIAGLKLAVKAIVTAVEEPDNRPAREAMAHSALLSGMALANSGLGLAHGVAAALGVHCRVPHGLACAALLPTALKVNRPVCEAAYADLHAAIDPDSALRGADAADAFVECIEQLCRRLEVPSHLTDLGVTAADVPALTKSSRGNSMDGNPRQLDDAELLKLLESLL